MVQCPYCLIPMQSLGFIESHDDLGIYVADTYTCSQCEYRLEKEPVYVGDLPEEQQPY